MPDSFSPQEYQNARKAGRRYLAEYGGKQGRAVTLMLEDKLREIETVGEIRLGTYEIPLENIAGTYTAARSTAFAGISCRCSAKDRICLEVAVIVFAPYQGWDQRSHKSL